LYFFLIKLLLWLIALFIAFLLCTPVQHFEEEQENKRQIKNKAKT